MKIKHMKKLTSASELPPVPKWWWDYGLKQELEKRRREGAEFDRAISASIKRSGPDAFRAALLFVRGKVEKRMF